MNRKPLPSASKTVQKLLWISDTHWPHHNKRTWALKMRAAEAFQPDIVVAGGDLLDIDSASSYRKSHKRDQLLIRELARCRGAFDDLKLLGAKKNVYLLGNHEHRLARYVADGAPALAEMLSIDSHFGLSAKGWEVVAYQKEYRIGALRLVHDLGKSGPSAHAHALDTFQNNALMGHTHRFSMTWSGDGKGGVNVGATCGHGCNPSMAEYLPDAYKRKHWVDGAMLAYLLPNGAVHMVPLVPNKGTLMVEGVIIR